MEAKTVFCSIVAFVCLSSINAIMVSSGKNITIGNCTGQLDYYLCNCVALKPAIDIHLSSGWYYFMHQPSCLLQNKTSIKLIGSSSNDTIIECKEPFSIVFARVRGVMISNITMVNCGDVVDDLVNQTVHNATDNTSHFGSGFRYAIMFYQVKDITITEVTMQNTMGYGIVAFNAIGNVTILKFSIVNTTFESDPKCKDYDYYSATANSSCSGSGIFLIYHDHIEVDSIEEANTILVIDQSNFVANRNILPYNQFTVLFDAINTGFFQTSIPLQGAASITVFYLQNLYDVNTIITNSMFHNNNGTLSACIAIGSLTTIRGKTLITKCLFDDNNRINRSTSVTSLNTRGGISYYYLTLKNVRPELAVNGDVNLPVVEIVAVVHCNFTKIGGTLGAAVYIEKISTKLQPLSFRIEQCNFIANEANVGSAVYAVEHRFDATLSNGLVINLINVNANGNTLLPGATVQYSSSAFITGIFHGETCHLKFDCNVGCNFSNNMPSVFYGHSAYLTISGKAIFFNNTARFGGGLRLVNTVAFIHQESDIYFYKNHATNQGGAIDVYFSTTNIQTQDICPIQFVGSSDALPVFSLENIDEINVNVSFEENTAYKSTTLESIYSGVFYVCTWYPNTLIQIKLGKSAPIMNGRRQSVYREILHFIPNSRADEHLSILAYLPCPCDENNTYDAQYCMTAEYNDTLELGTTVIVGRSFNISLITLDVVGSIGHSLNLYSEVSSLNTTNNILTILQGQRSRKFSIANRACTAVEFTIYALQSAIPPTGILHLSLSQNSDHNLHFSFAECPVGFSLQNVSGLYACACGEFFYKSPIKEDFQCDSLSGKIKRTNVRSWLSVINNRVEYTKYCLPEYCNDKVCEFNLADNNKLCTHNHTGRACGACEDSLSKTFGSKFCRKCSNVSLVTILLYGILGIILVLIIHLLKLTVTMGTINGIIFFCNVMSINETLFFDPSRFSFIRIFVSIINLDLGFEMCFYREMSQIGKTGLQFVFPLYLWLLMFIIIMIGKHYMRSRKSTHSAVPVLATLILLSYSKILRTTISVFSSVTVRYANNDFSGSQQYMAWQSDPNIKYFKGAHIALFLVALVFTVLFILPLAFALTFPKIILRSKKMSYFFPLLDCIYAPYKNQHRYWFGVRLFVLIYLSGMESIVFSYQNSLLLSGVLVVLFFAFVQAYIHPFKNKINNILDLMFMGIFITLAIVILYLYPNASHHMHKENIAVNILGSVAFILFCFIIIFHLHDALMHFTWYSKLTEPLKTKFNKNMQKNLKPLHSITSRDIIQKPDNRNIDGSLKYACLQESLLEEQFT